MASHGRSPSVWFIDRPRALQMWKDTTNAMATGQFGKYDVNNELHYAWAMRKI